MDKLLYQKQGYLLHKKPVLSPEKFKKLKDIFEEYLKNASGNSRTDELDTPHFNNPRLFEFLLDENVIRLVRPLIGPNIGLWSSHFISKEPFEGRATPWHEDSAYWEGKLDKFDKVVTVWLAIDRTNKDNGCMRVIPGTHTGGFSNYEDVDSNTFTFDKQIASNQVDESKAVYFELEPNECSLHDSRIIHGAKANTSPNRRCGYTMRYFSLDAIFYSDKFTDHKVYYVEGENIANNKLEPVPQFF